VTKVTVTFSNIMDERHYDFLRLDDLLTPEQLHLRQQVRDFMNREVLPTINDYWEAAEFPREMAMKLKGLPIMGGMLEGYGCAGLKPLEYGLVRYEMARADGSISTFYGVQNGLAMNSIGKLGSEEQKERWLPGMARLEKIGAFGLTEPERGSDAAHILTTFERRGDNYVLNGRKRWIGNAAIADLLIIWARNEAGEFGGFVIEDPRETEGVMIQNIGGKISKRSVLNADITLEEVVVPAANRLEKVRSFRHLSEVLAQNRYAIGWEAAGLGAGCFEWAREYALQREQFGRPIGSFQLIQQKLVEMLSMVTDMQLLCLQLARLMESGEITSPMLSLAKYANSRKARQVAQLAREVLGGNGILIENHIARLMLDAEAVYTYEGTNEINLLIIGREITGISAFT
jgi:glutaryl-CoA dehydrogenase